MRGGGGGVGRSVGLDDIWELCDLGLEVASAGCLWG